MSTAQEIELKRGESLKALDAYLSIVGPTLDGMIKHVAETPWRPVCAKRARKLRKRGESVSYSHRTNTGKARYKWFPYKWALNPLMILA